MALKILHNVVSNGFSEEFLFRGAILGRLRLVVSHGGALFVQAVVFGFWHFGANMHGFRGDLPNALAACVVGQGPFGYAMGYLALRTRSIFIPSAFHALYNALPPF